jgi:hypothetical protein
MFSISETLSWSKAAFLQHFKMLAAISVINLIPFVILELIPEHGIASNALTALVSLASVVVSYLVMAAMYHVCTVAVVGGDIAHEAIIARAKAMFFPMLWIAALAMFFSFAWAPTIVGVIVASIFAALALPVLFIEGKRGTAAIATSITLVKGKFWRSTGYGVIALLIVIVPFLLVTLAVSTFGPATGADVSFAGGIIINAFTYIFVTPVIAVASFGLYRSLRAITPEPEAEVFAKRVKFVKITTVVGVLIAVVIVTALIVALLFGSFGP